MLCGPVTGQSVGSTIDRINKDLQSPSYMLYTLTTISVWFTDIHSNCQPAPASTPAHTRQLFAFMAHVCASVCVCMCVLVVLSGTCIRQLVVQFIQYINFNNMWVHTPKGEERGAGQARPLYNYFRLLQTNPASKTAAPAVAAVAAAVTTMARTMTGLTARIRNIGTGILLSWQPHRIRIRIETFRAQMSLTPSH